MHEGHFTDQIVEEILKELKKYPGSTVKTVKVTVGEVYHLVLESVLMHFEISVKGTPLQGVVLDLKEDPMQVCCQECAKTGAVQDHHMPQCSFCGGLSVKTVSGNSITIDSIEFIE